MGNDKEDMDDTSIKIFNLDKVDENGPYLVRALKITKTQVFPISCLAVKEDCSQIAIGMCNGAVVSFHGDILRDRSPKQTCTKN